MIIKRNIIIALCIVFLMFFGFYFLDSGKKQKFEEQEIKTRKVKLSSYQNSYVTFNKLRHFEDGSNYISGFFYSDDALSTDRYINLSCLNLFANGENLGAPTIFHPLVYLTVNNIDIVEIPIEGLEWGIQAISSNFETSNLELKVREKCQLFSSETRVVF